MDVLPDSSNERRAIVENENQRLTANFHLNYHNQLPFESNFEEYNTISPNNQSKSFLKGNFKYENTSEEYKKDYKKASDEESESKNNS